MSDLPDYIVVCGNHIKPYLPERDLADTTWQMTVKDIADGQFPSLRCVIETKTGDDVTIKVASECADLWSSEPLRQWQFEFLELTLGTRKARTFMLESA